jgi:drug/metabolite transporter (DMT)-like permease
VTGVSAFYAFSGLPLAQVYARLFAAPMLITILAIPVLGEVVRLRRWIAVLVGLAGVLVVLRPGSTDLTLGHLAALAAAIGGSLASIVVRKIGNEERPVVMLLYPMMVNFVLMACALPFVYVPMPIEHLGMLAIIATFAWFARRLVIAAYQAGEAALIAPMQYSQIIWASIFGYLFFDETIDQATAIGASIIIASGMYIVLRESRGTSENTPVLRTRSRGETATTPRVSLFMRIAGKKPPRQDDP